jgi:hypothetical protein
VRAQVAERAWFHRLRRRRCSGPTQRIGKHAAAIFLPGWRVRVVRAASNAIEKKRRTSVVTGWAWDSERPSRPVRRRELPPPLGPRRRGWGPVLPRGSSAP